VAHAPNIHPTGIPPKAAGKLFDMKTDEAAIPDMFRKDVRSVFDKYLPRIVQCLQLLSEQDIWWRPNAASNAAGNIVLHLSGNVRQWIISGLGGARDVRERDKEFAEHGPIAREALIARLKNTIEEALQVIDAMSVAALSREFDIQGYRVTGLSAVAHVAEHFAYHTGQVIYVTKLKLGVDLHFTQLPNYKPAEPDPSPRK
jgi:uncharacterized damage-inducible protein DinB